MFLTRYGSRSIHNPMGVNEKSSCKLAFLKLIRRHQL
jgi:hypothetical protein